MTPSATTASRADFGAHAASRDVTTAWITALALVVGACWLLVFNQLRLEWTVNPTYGWLRLGCPLFIAAFLFWERWRGRPAAERPRTAYWLLVPVLALLFYLPARVVQEANPDWVKATTGR